jgi:hypothetical protein
MLLIGSEASEHYLVHCMLDDDEDLAKATAAFVLADQKLHVS